MRTRLRKTVRLLLALTAISLLLTGCWDLEEIEHRTFVMAVGFDRTEDGKIECTVQYPRPQALNFARGQNPSSPSEQFVTISATGTSAWEALMEVNEQTAGRVYLGQLQALILGENLARDGIGPVMDGLMRHARVNRRARVLVAADAGQIIRQPIPGQLLPSIFFCDFYDSDGNQEETAELIVWRAWLEVAAPLESGFIPYVKLRAGQFQLDGIGLIRDGKLVARLDDAAARGFNWLRGDVKSGEIVARAADRQFTVRNQRSRRRLTEAWWDGDIPHITIQIRATGDLSESTSMTGSSSPGTRQQIEQAVEAEIQSETEQALKTMLQAGADSLKLGEYMRVADPRGWNLERWKAAFPKANITVTVDFTLGNTGVLQGR